MRAHLLLLGLAALPSLGCGDPHGSSPTNLRVSVSTTGVDRDGDYVLRTGDGATHPIRASLFLFLPPGDQDLVLEGVATNCSIEGSDSVRVPIGASGVNSVAFQVACRAVTGAIEVSVMTSGRDFDPNGYTVDLDDVRVGRVFSGGAIIVEGVSPGRHVVRLDDFSSNCQVSGTPSRSTTVSAGGFTRDTVRVTFQGSCHAITGDVQILTTTRGVDRDRNGYTVTVNGVLQILPCGFYDYYCTPDTPLLLVPEGSYLFAEVPAGDHTYAFGDIGSNCAARDGDSRTVSVTSGDTTIVRLDVICDPA